MTVHVAQKDKFLEDRGEIFTFFDNKDFPLQIDFVQDKVSISHKGVVRGFHGDSKTYKLITCIHGKVKFVTYDLKTSERREFILDSEDKLQTSVLLSPFVLNAHQCLTKSCIFLYKLSEYYTCPEEQWSVEFNDASINPKWPIETTVVSTRDKNSGSLKELKVRLKNEL